MFDVCSQKRIILKVSTNAKPVKSEAWITDYVYP